MRPGFGPSVGKIPWRWEWQPTPIFLPENSMDRGAGGLLSLGLQRLRGNWATNSFIFYSSWSLQDHQLAGRCLSTLMRVDLLYSSYWFGLFQKHRPRHTQKQCFTSCLVKLRPVELAHEINHHSAPCVFNDGFPSFCSLSSLLSSGFKSHIVEDGMMFLVWGLINFFCKGTDSKFSRLCRLCSLCYNHSVLLL